MSHRAHLFSLRIGHAFKESCINEKYTLKTFWNDLLAGLTVGLIAIPLAMALAIASGVAPQYGLYTVIIAGIVIALCGGSRFSISGPTAAFVIILYPITQTYGFGGLLTATVLAGLILILLALLRLGRLIEYIPEPVTLGFTGGIAVVLVTLQIKDFAGLSIEQMPESYLEKLQILFHSIPQAHAPSLAIASITLAIMLLWPRLKTALPPHLPALLVGALAAYLFNKYGLPVETIGSRFSYIMSDGSTGYGIPSVLPHFSPPWKQPGPDGAAMIWNWQMIKDLLPKAFAIAMLGAIESLLCAVVLDGMSGKRHSANSELLGQGLGNVVTPFFGGITATAAIARSAANFKAGAKTPIAAVIHAVVVLLAVVAMAPLLAYLPMPAMASLLLIVAWNMSEAPKTVHLLKTSPKSDIWVFLCCFSLTILFDMVIAITCGIILAALLFMKEIAEMTKVKEINDHPLPSGWSEYKIYGPLFFAAADKVFSELYLLTRDKQGVILDFEGVSILDAGGLMALEKFRKQCKNANQRLMLTHLQFQPLKNLSKAGIHPKDGELDFYPTRTRAMMAIESKAEKKGLGINLATLDQNNLMT